MSSIWPPYLRRIIEETTILFAQSYELARQRVLGSQSACKRLMAERDDAILDAKLLRREIAVLKRSREKIPQQKRPHYLPSDRFEILQLKRHREWSIAQTAEHFVLHPNTVSSWCRAWTEKDNVNIISGTIPWNRISEGVRWMVHQLRILCPEKEFGTRTIAMHLLRNGIQISRSSVRRILKHRTPTRPPNPSQDQNGSQIPHGILRPKHPNMTWHMDFTTVNFLFTRFYIAAIIDGFSRKMLALKLCRRTPDTRCTLKLFRTAVDKYGTPRFMVTDHGCQFRKQFTTVLMNKFHVIPVKGKVHTYYMNGKIERFFRTFKWWQRLTLFHLSYHSIQKRLDIYQGWYNTVRSQYNLGARTPEEVWKGTRLSEAMPVYERDPIKPAMAVRKEHYRDDPNLPVLDIEVIREAKRAA